MSRTLLPFHTGDISALAKSLGRQLAEHETAPGHVELLNMLVRSAGYRNFQHFRAQMTARDGLDALASRAAPEPVEPVDYVLLRRLLRFFDADGRMIRWPNKRGQQHTCLWVIWAGLPAREVISGRDMDERLKAAHLFGDHPLLRRWMCDYGMLTRTPDGREYRRVEQAPPVLAQALIRQVAARSGH